MDPDTAFANILTGYLLADHIESLHGWLAREGFAPAPRDLPDFDDCAPFLQAHLRRHYIGVDLATVQVRADRAGLWSASNGEKWISLAIWPELLSAHPVE